MGVSFTSLAFAQTPFALQHSRSRHFWASRPVSRDSKLSPVAGPLACSFAGIRTRVALTVVVAAWLLAATVPAVGQAAREEPRIALVIGNGAYRETPLRNPVNDARAMVRTLRELGFTVLTHENASKRTMEGAIVEFGQRLAQGGVGFFYYAGHGLQVRGRNFLVPVDADIDSEATTRIAAVDVDLLLEQMAEAKNRVNVVILDACRNNPFERRMRGASRGLAAVAPPAARWSRTPRRPDRWRPTAMAPTACTRRSCCRRCGCRTSRSRSCSSECGSP